MSDPGQHPIRTAYHGKMSWPAFLRSPLVDLALWPLKWSVELLLWAIITLGLGMAALLHLVWHTLEKWL